MNASNYRTNLAKIEGMILDAMNILPGIYRDCASRAKADALLQCAGYAMREARVCLRDIKDDDVIGGEDAND